MTTSWWPIAWELLLTTAVICSTAFTIFLSTLPTRYNPSSSKDLGKDATGKGDQGRREDTASSSNHSEAKKPDHEVSVQVVVLGDIGRSPRMQYHAISIAKGGGRVSLIGYQESDLHPEIKSNSSISVVPLSSTPSFLRTSDRLLFLILGPLKVIFQIADLYRALGYRSEATRWMLVQNPPSIPTLAIAQFICFLRNTKLVIDWHNFGYSILALRLGPSHPLVRISEWYEAFFARFASSHFTVTDAMARVLRSKYGLDALALHDRPPNHFQPLSPEQRRDFLPRLRDETDLPDVVIDAIHAERCKLIVSSTSWTPDEDFQLFLDALVEYSSRAVRNKADIPYVIAVITGKGPQKVLYEARIDELVQQGKLGGATIVTAWLSSEDYAALLGAADLGVSLHTSSSGVDLPMKVVDMFGAGLPVAGWSQFEAWPELVKEGINGRGFESAEQLSDILIELFKEGSTGLAELKKGALEEGKRRWDDEWMPIAGRLFRLK
jgi:beta-1,4-mannosyltransferase